MFGLLFRKVISFLVFILVIFNICIFVVCKGDNIWGMVNYYIGFWLFLVLNYFRIFKVGVILCLEVLDYWFVEL